MLEAGKVYEFIDRENKVFKAFPCQIGIRCWKLISEDGCNRYSDVSGRSPEELEKSLGTLSQIFLKDGGPIPAQELGQLEIRHNGNYAERGFWLDCRKYDWSIVVDVKGEKVLIAERRDK